MDVIVQSSDKREQIQGNVRLWFRLVGDFEAHLQNGRSVLPVSKKARALLALIAAHMPQAIRRDLAASLLWSNKPRDHAANSLRQALRELQIALAACGQPPVLLAGGGRLTLQSDMVWIDTQDPVGLRWKAPGHDTPGPVLLCQNLQGLDPAFDQHLGRLWSDLVFQQAFVSSDADSEPDDARPPSAQAAPPDQDEAPAAVRHDTSRLAAYNVADLTAPTATDDPYRFSDDSAPPILRADETTHGKGWRIAVLPFRSLGPPLAGGLSLGMAEEISAALARFRMPRLIATGSFWNGSGVAADALAKCRAYNLDYVISGTIQASGQRIRVTVTLLDVSMDFEVIWASRFEGTTDDLFKLQDTIASQTVARIDPELLQRHQFRGETVQVASGAAHQAVLTAIQGIYHPDKARFLKAGTLLHTAIETDPDYAAAHAWLAYWYIIGTGQGWIDNPRNASERAGVAAERSIALDPLDARGITIAGHVKAYLLHDLEAALTLHQRAISLNPNLPIAWTLSSWAHIYNGDHAIAVNEATVAESLSPNDPHVFFVEHAATTAHLFLRNLERADELAASVMERKPGHASALKVRLAILGHLGRPREAEQYLDALGRIIPDLSIDCIIARPPLRPHDRAYYAAGLRLAGVKD